VQLAERDMQGPLIGTGSHFGSRQAPRLDLAEGSPVWKTNDSPPVVRSTSYNQLERFARNPPLAVG